MWRVDSHDFANAESRNDERIERLYFLQKQNEAKIFIGLRYAQILFCLDTSLHCVSLSMTRWAQIHA